MVNTPEEAVVHTRGGEQFVPVHGAAVEAQDAAPREHFNTLANEALTAAEAVGSFLTFGALKGRSE